MKTYPPNKHTYIKDLKHLVYNQAENKPDYAAFQYTDRGGIKTITYKQFKNDIEMLGTYFYSEDMRNSKVAIIGENSYEWILTYFAVVLGSNVIVPMDKDLPDDDIYEQISRVGADYLVYSDSCFDLAKYLLDNGKVKTAFNMKNFTSYIQMGEKLLIDGVSEFIDNGINENEVCSIIFTSGTTGKPKGVMLSQRNLAVDAVCSCERVYIEGSSLLTLPLYHTYAFLAGVLSMMLCGVTIIINNSMNKITDDMQTFKPQNMCVFPCDIKAMYEQIWKTAKEQNRDKRLKRKIGVSNLLRKIGVDVRQRLFVSARDILGGKLSLIVSGGADIDKKYIKNFEDIGILVLNGYGITECSPVVAVNNNNYNKTDSVGLPLSCCDVKMVAGEICVKGDNVMLGYYEDEKATKEAFYGEYFRTGDLGYLDNDGFLHITGRRKNTIILSSGKNVSPEELEEKLLAIPNVIEAMVYGDKDLIVADIYAEDTKNINHAVAELNKTLPLHKQIQRIRFRNTEFDKTDTKKIVRRSYV